MNVIFGSGLVGLIARHILGPSYKIIPFYRSRFYSFNPALDDNFLVRDKRTDDFVCSINNGKLGSTYLYKKAWSIAGQLVNKYDAELCYSWCYKLFGNHIPSQSFKYWEKQIDVFIYDLRLNQLYERLCNNYMNEIKESHAAGPVTEIGDHYYVQGGNRYEFDKAISTIPLPVLNKLMKLELILDAKTIHYLHIETDSLNFESNNQVMVVDKDFDFYKVTNVAPNRYLMYCHVDIANPGSYLMPFMERFDIIDGTSIQDAIPCGEIPSLALYESKGIECVGSNAQWDWCMDVSSCIIKLMRIANNTEAMKEVNILR